jgi:hypothetical protein
LIDGLLVREVRWGVDYRGLIDNLALREVR